MSDKQSPDHLTPEKAPASALKITPGHKTWDELLMSVLRDTFNGFIEPAMEMVLSEIKWIDIAAGETLFNEGDDANEMYFVVSGRLKAEIVNADNVPVIINEFSRGDTVGEVSLLLNRPRTLSASALRDSRLASIERSMLVKITEKHPLLALAVSNLVIQRQQETLKNQNRTKQKITNIVIHSLQENVNAFDFGMQFMPALKPYGKVELVCADRVRQQFGDDAFCRHDSPLLNWLDEFEHSNRFVLYVTEKDNTVWNELCIRHTDRALLLVRADYDLSGNPPSFKDSELSNACRRHLVILHKDRNQRPSQIKKFIDSFGVMHHLNLVENDHLEMCRLARSINGSSNGIVCAGGGARGFVHLGVIKAMNEFNIPIDMIGGTSMGAIMAGAHAITWDINTLIDVVRDIFVVQKPLTDYTMPLVSFYKGKKLDRLLTEFYQGRDIADCWIPFFCVAGNLSRGNTAVHIEGELWKTIRSSLSLPGVVPPVLFNGDMMVDGGLVNNYPIDEMIRFGAGRTIGIDIVDESSDYNLSMPDFPGVWQLIRHRYLGGKLKDIANVPTIMTILTKSALLSSAQSTKHNTALADYNLAPSVKGFGLLAFNKFDDIYESGYRHAMERFSAMSDEELNQLRL